MTWDDLDMADLPANVGTGIVRISLRRTALNHSTSPATVDVLPVTGKITFTPSAPRLINAFEGMIIPTSASSVNLDANGDAVVTLMATDDPDQNPVDWTYTVSFALDNATVDSFSISVPEGSDQELADITPVPQAGGTYYLTGEAGPTGATGPAGADAALPDYLSNTAGRWHGPMGPAANYGQLGNTVTFHPMIFPRDLTITDIGFYVATAGDASAIVRVGLATRALGSEAFSVDVDWGQVTATSTGDKTITGLSTAVTANTPYYWVVGMHGQSATTPILRGTADYGMGGYQFLGSAVNTVGTNNMMGWRAGYNGGAFSASITPNATAYFQYPNIFFQI